MISIAELCVKVELEREQIQKIGQPAASISVKESVQSLIAMRAWAAKHSGVHNEKWQQVEEQYFNLITETFGAADETALALSKKMVILTKELCEK